MDGGDAHAIAQRVIGSISGMVVAVAFFWPRTPKEFVQIVVTSLITGIVMAYPFREWMEWAPTQENRIAAGAVMAFGAMPVAQWFIRWVKRKDDDAR